MDFSNGAFETTNSTSSISTDTVSHAQLVQACRFGWSALPNGTAPASSAPVPAPIQTRPITSLTDTRSRRLTPCRGRLYHQLTCSHRIRTDLVDDCGPNCLEPSGTASSVPFYCEECVEKEAMNIWTTREAQHNAMYPPIEEMTKEQYDNWYDERRKLEAKFALDRKIYDGELKSTTRPSNKCSAQEMSDAEKEFVAELDALSFSMMTSNEVSVSDYQPRHRPRVSLPNDSSEQLHWGLNSLALDRGSCGVEYSHGQPMQAIPAMSEEQLWKPRGT